MTQEQIIEAAVNQVRANNPQPKFIHVNGYEFKLVKSEPITYQITNLISPSGK